MTATKCIDCARTIPDDGPGMLLFLGTEDGEDFRIAHCCMDCWQARGDKRRRGARS